MLKVAICDDEEAMRNRIEYLARVLAEDLNTPIVCQQFSSGTALLADYPPHLDILFLDVRLSSSETGLSVAERIRKTDAHVTIVFASSFPEYAVAGYRVQAYRFLVKPIEYPEFRREIAELFIKAAHDGEGALSIKSGSKTYAIPPSHISFIETAPGEKVVIHCDEGDLTCTGMLTPWESKLPSHDFFRVHASFIVSLDSIRSCGKETLELVTGQVIPISKRRRKKFTETYARYISRKL